MHRRKINFSLFSCCFFTYFSLSSLQWAESSILKRSYYNFSRSSNMFLKIEENFSEIENEHTEKDSTSLERTIFEYIGQCKEYKKLLKPATSNRSINIESQILLMRVLEMNEIYLKTFPNGTAYENVVNNKDIQILVKKNISDLMSKIEISINPLYGNSSGLTGLLDMMSTLYQEPEVIFITRKKFYYVRRMQCDDRISVQQRLFHMTNCVSLTLMSGYFLILKLNKGNAKIKYEHIKRMKSSLLSITRHSEKNIKEASQAIRRCDPHVYEEGKNFVQLSLMHKIIVAADYFYESPVCDESDSCKDFTNRVSFAGLERPAYHCTGRLFDCVDTTINEICFPENRQGTRRYQAFTDGEGKRIGPWNENCTETNVAGWKTVGRGKYTKNLRGINFSEMYDFYCKKCVCFCSDYDNPRTIQKFSLRPLRVKHDQGAITGVKFAVEADTIVLKIRVGILVDGKIVVQQPDWSSRFVSEIDDNENNSTRSKNSYESVKLRYDWRSVLLGDIQGPPGTIAQGVKFVKGRNGIGISVLATKINRMGKLLPETAQWYSNNIDDVENSGIHERREIQIPDKLNIPTNVKPHDLIFRDSNSYVKFQTTDWILDASQTTIPFLDIQEVISDPPEPMAGVGLYYKFSELSSGFIGLELLSFNYSYFLSEDIINLSG